MTLATSEAVRFPSVAVRVNSNVVAPSTCGASNVTILDKVSPRDACGLAGDVWAHVYVRAFDDAPVALPESVTGSPSRAATRDSAWTASPAGPVSVVPGSDWTITILDTGSAALSAASVQE